MPRIASSTFPSISKASFVFLNSNLQLFDLDCVSPRASVDNGVIVKAKFTITHSLSSEEESPCTFLAKV